MLKKLHENAMTRVFSAGYDEGYADGAQRRAELEAARGFREGLASALGAAAVPRSHVSGAETLKTSGGEIHEMESYALRDFMSRLLRPPEEEEEAAEGTRKPHEHST